MPKKTLANKKTRTVLRKGDTRPPTNKEVVPVSLPASTTGTRGQINADIESIDPVRFSKDKQFEKLRSGEMTGGDLLLAMHYRGATVSEMARRLNVKDTDVRKMLGEIYERTDRELIESPQKMRLEIGGTLLRWFRKIDERVMSGEASPHELKGGILIADKLAKLTGANAPEEHEIRTVNLNATVEAKVTTEEMTAVEILENPVFRDEQMKRELQALVGKRGNGAEKEIPLARVLPGSLSDARPRAVPGARPYSDDDDPADEVGGEDYH